MEWYVCDVREERVELPSSPRGQAYAAAQGRAGGGAEPPRLSLSLTLSLSINNMICICVYIYIYREREIDRQIDRQILFRIKQWMLFTLPDVCVSYLRGGQANLLRVSLQVQRIDPRRGSVGDSLEVELYIYIYVYIERER